MTSPPVPTLPPSSSLSGYSSSPPDFISPLVRYSANEEAQQYVWDAWDVESFDAKFNLLRHALEIFPFSVDALNCWADIYYRLYRSRLVDGEHGNLEKAAATYKLALQAARLLWPTLEQCQSIEWGFIEHRPFLRAQHGLAMIQKEMGKLKAAKDKFTFLLHVNPNDNQGARVLLFECLIELGEYREAEAIAEKHSNGRKSTETYFRYGFVLIDYLKFKLGDCSKEDVQETLLQALQCNNWVPHLLLGYIPMSERPQYVSPGSLDEAVDYVSSAMPTWQNIAGILDWLQKQAVLGGKRPTDDGSTLFRLLQKGKIVVQRPSVGEADSGMMEVTSKVSNMTGQGLETFQLPAGMKHHHPSRIVAFRRGKECEEEDGFVCFPYGEVSAVPFWKIMVEVESFGKDHRELFCNFCFKPATMKCSACQCSWYCSAVCQKKDWKRTDGRPPHKAMCKRLIKT